LIIREPHDLATCVEEGWLEVGAGAVIEMNVELCHPTMSGEQARVVVGEGARIRSGSVLYSGVRIGAESQTGHHVVVRENTHVGASSVVGTGVKVEHNCTIGNHVLIETQAHIASLSVAEDYVFIGPGCITTNDYRMLHRRAGAREELRGPTFRWGCRIGGGAVILPGMTVGREAVVAAGSVVSRDVPERTIAGGNPLRLLGPIRDDEPVLLTS
jgi:UDP-2-acetamido-3-amino-2,3-dideoxy-glucuronate N-acetyltransferase